MTGTNEKILERLKRLEREVERLRVKERPAGGSGVTDHGALTGLADNDHPQYLLTTGKAADSELLDGINSTGFVQTSGDQTIGGVKTFSSLPTLPTGIPTANQPVRKGYADLAYLSILATAQNSDKLDGLDSTAFALVGHDHNADYLGISAKAADSDKLDGKTLAQVMLSIYPVGAIFMSSASTNPSTLFGGTWEAYGQGRVLVGKATLGTFATAGSTGGDETHSHELSAGFAKIVSSVDGWIAMARKTVSTWAITHKNNALNNATLGTVSVGADLGGTTDKGSTLQPYVVVYMWRRTG